MGRVWAAIALAVASAAGPLAAQAQPAPPSDTAEAQGPAAPARPTADEIAEAARLSLKPSGVREPCKAPKGNEIVVCAQDPNALRVPSDTDSGVNTSTGVPRAPDVFGIPQKGVIVARGCFIPPCPRKMPPLIDLKSIPEAPPGSDAARFADVAGDRRKVAPAPAAVAPASPAAAP